MPDIGLLQGPPRPKLIVVPPLAVEAAATPTPLPVLEMAEEGQVIKVAAHGAVVSNSPMAVLRAPRDERPQDPVPVAAEPALESAAAAPVKASAPDTVGIAPLGGEPVAPAIAVPPPIRSSDLLWLLLALLLIVATGLGIRDPWPADEPRFASLARDMAQTGEWLFPRVGGDLYQDKPPLFFWLLALSHGLFGAFKGWFLIPSLFAAAGVLFLIYDFGRRTVSRESGLAAAIITLCTLQFVLAFRGAQIDPTLCLLTTFSIYAFLRHLLLGHGWRWYVLGGFAAGLGIFTKGVGFLPVLLLIPFFVLRGFRWNGLAPVDAGRGGWRWWLAPLAMLAAVSMWFLPMVIAASNGSPEYAAYRDEILFKQTVGRYAAAWHHVKPWYYFVVEVIPALWLPWSILLVWLVPKFRAAFRERDARVWLPLAWVMLVITFFSLSPGKRGIYVMPALPALALASLPLLADVLARRGVRIAGWVLGVAFLLAAIVLAAGHAAGTEFATRPLAKAGLTSAAALYAYIALCGAGLLWAWRRAPLFAWPVALASLTVVFSYLIAPAMNGERSGSEFTRGVLRQVKHDEQLALVAYKEQFLLYLDRPSVNFGHRRWQEGPQEFFDAAAWLNAAPGRVLLVPEEGLEPKDRFNPRQPAIPCFTVNAVLVGQSSDDDWYLVRSPAESACAALGDAGKAIRYPAHSR